MPALHAGLFSVEGPLRGPNSQDQVQVIFGPRQRSFENSRGRKPPVMGDIDGKSRQRRPKTRLFVATGRAVSLSRILLQLLAVAALPNARGVSASATPRKKIF